MTMEKMIKNLVSSINRSNYQSTINSLIKLRTSNDALVDAHINMLYDACRIEFKIQPVISLGKLCDKRAVKPILEVLSNSYIEPSYTSYDYFGEFTRHAEYALTSLHATNEEIARAFINALVRPNDEPNAIKESRKIYAVMQLSKLGNKLATLPILNSLPNSSKYYYRVAIDAIIEIGGDGAAEIQSAIANLRFKIPEGRRYKKEEKVYEFLPKALELFRSNIEFEIGYQAEKGHMVHHEGYYKKVIDYDYYKQFEGGGESWNQTYFSASMLEGMEDDPDVITKMEYVPPRDEWIVDLTEKIEIVIGDNWNIEIE